MDTQLIRKPVLSKKQFVPRYAAGEFGNASPTWDSLDAMEEQAVLEYAGNDTRYHIRNRITSGPTYYDVKVEDLADKWWDLVGQGAKEADLYISEMAPTHLTLFQGEVERSTRHLSLFYSTVREPMRSSLQKGGKQVYGATAKVLLEHFLCPNSLDWMYALLDWYPDHVVEFSTYDKPWGTIPNFNTIFWEVRKY